MGVRFVYVRLKECVVANTRVLLLHKLFEYQDTFDVYKWYTIVFKYIA